MIRHAINPTSPFRMQLILETALNEMQATMSSTPKFDADNLVDQLLDMKISDTDQTKVKVSCNCTRKCKTKLCQCFKEAAPCNKERHPANSSCTNYQN